jgi:hypothetical protein
MIWFTLVVSAPGTSVNIRVSSPYAFSGVLFAVCPDALSETVMVARIRLKAKRRNLFLRLFVILVLLGWAKNCSG